MNKHMQLQYLTMQLHKVTVLEQWFTGGLDARLSERVFLVRGV